MYEGTHRLYLRVWQRARGSEAFESVVLYMAARCRDEDPVKAKYAWPEIGAQFQIFLVTIQRAFGRMCIARLVLSIGSSGSKLSRKFLPAIP